MARQGGQQKIESQPLMVIVDFRRPGIRVSNGSQQGQVLGS